MIAINNHSLAILILGTLLLPLPSIQHFIWPLSWCLLADICNHTWIPECGLHDDNYRIFLDECDMFEYNCDFLKDYEIVNYSDCFRPASDCPTPAPCPSRPTCKDHRFHRMMDPYGDRRMLVLHTPPISVPKNMLRGKRRYTPIPKIMRTHPKTEKRKPNPRPIIRRTIRRTLRAATCSTTIMQKKTSMQMIILKRETIIRNGLKFVKVIKGFAWNPEKPLKIVEEIKGQD